MAASGQGLKISSLGSFLHLAILGCEICIQALECLFVAVKITYFYQSSMNSNGFGRNVHVPMLFCLKASLVPKKHTPDLRATKIFIGIPAGLKNYLHLFIQFPLYCFFAKILPSPAPRIHPTKHVGEKGPLLEHQAPHMCARPHPTHPIRRPFKSKT